MDEVRDHHSDDHSDAGTGRLIDTRRQLHGIAEGLLAGPQHRACRRISLRVVPGGFATVGAPALRLDGTDLVVDEEHRVPLSGTFGSVGAATGHDFGEPTHYRDHSGQTASDVIDLDPVARQRIVAFYERADAALRVLAPTETPTLWPEHFDVAILVDDHSIGASPGDDFCPTPYAYVGDATLERDDYWNAPFGACQPYDATPSIAALVAFWSEGLRRLSNELGGN